MRNTVLVAGAVVATLVEVAASAPSAFSPEHGKINTADATPVGAQVFEVEVGYAPSWAIRRGWGRFEDSETAYQQPLGLSVTYGLTDDFDATFGTGYAFVRDESYDHDPEDGVVGPSHGHGHSDETLGVRWRLLRATELALDLALITELTLATGSYSSTRMLGTSQECFSWDSALVASEDWGRTTGNLGVGWSQPFGAHREENRGILAANLAVGHHVLDWLQPELEVNYARDFQAAAVDPEIVAATVGVVVPWGDGNRITAGFQQAVWGHDTRAFTAASAAYKAAF